MPLAIHEKLLPGHTIHEKLMFARQYHLAGVELDGAGLPERVLAVAAAMDATNIKVAAVNLTGRAYAGYIAPDRDQRMQAIDRLRQVMGAACDLQAPSVTIVPHYAAPDAPTLPDLTPFRTQADLEAEMYVWFLRTVNDLAAAMDVVLCMQPVNAYETHFLNTIGQAAEFHAAIQHHPSVGIAPHLFHAAVAEEDLFAALRDHAASIKHIYLSDHNHRLPGMGWLNLEKLAQTLRDMAYRGWLTITAEGHYSGTALEACVAQLHRAGID